MGAVTVKVTVSVHKVCAHVSHISRYIHIFAYALSCSLSKQLILVFLLVPRSISDLDHNSCEKIIVTQMSNHKSDVYKSHVK